MAGAAATTKQSANSSGQFGEGKRFGQVIVGARVESADFFFHDARVCQKHDREIRFARADGAKEAETQSSIEFQVEQDQIKRLLESQALGLAAPGCELNRELLGKQRERDSLIGLGADWIEVDKIDAAIAATAFRGVIRSDGMEFREARVRKASGTEVIAFDEVLEAVSRWAQTLHSTR